MNKIIQSTRKGLARGRSTTKGFTMIELLLYVSMISIILISVSVFLAVLLEARVKNQNIAQLDQQGIQIMDLISQTARNATSINSPSAGASSSTLSLHVADGALDPTIFDLSSGVLRIKEGSGSIVNLTSSNITASGLTFTNLSRSGTFGTIRIVFTLASSSTLSRQEYNFSKTFTSSATLTK